MQAINGYPERVHHILNSLEIAEEDYAEDLEAVENDEYGDHEVADYLRDKRDDIRKSREYFREIEEALKQAYEALGAISAGTANDEISAELFGDYFNEGGSGYEARRALERAVTGRED